MGTQRSKNKQRCDDARTHTQSAPIIDSGAIGPHNMKRFPGISSALLLFVVSIGAPAAVSEPSDVVRMTTDKVLERIKNEKEFLRGNPGEMYLLVSETVFPHFDFAIMAKWVLGRHWSEADEETRDAFVEQFRKLLVGTYATALLNFSDQAITYPPIE